MDHKQSMQLRGKKKEKGQSFFEVVLALALVAIVLMALVSLATVSVRTATFSRNKNLATRLSQEAIEWLRSQRDAGWTNFVTKATTANWCLVNLDWSQPGSCNSTNVVTDTGIVRQVTLSIPDATTVQADVKASWVDGQGSHQITTSTFFTSWK
ncbi:MAG TPA: hypothetical protein VF185_03405 [Patescibacteria group bacterium]